MNATTQTPTTTNVTTSGEVLARAFLGALLARDFPRLRALLAPGAGMRALTPRKVIEEAGADAVVARFATWFADARRFDAIATRTGRVAERGMMSYQLRTSDDEGVFDILQHAFVDAREGRIHRIDLLCSGLLPIAQEA